MAEPPLKPPLAPHTANSGFGDKAEHAIERRTLRDYYIILRERLWIALPLALLASIGLFYKQSRETPLYMARTTMQFEKPDRVVTTEGVVDPSIKSEVDLNTRLQTLNSQYLRQKVIDSFTPDEVKVLQKPFLSNLVPGASPPTAAAALGSVYAESIRNSFLIAITCQHPDPDAAALVANRFREMFMEDVFDHMSGSNDQAVEYLTTRAETLRLESEQADQRLQAYMQAHKLVSLDSSMNVVDERYRSADRARTSARLQRLELETQVKQVDEFQREGRNLLEIAHISTYGPIPTLKAQLAELTRSQSVLAERYLERHPTMRKFADDVAIVEEQLQRAIDLAVADLKTSHAKAIQSEENLTRELALHETQALQLREVGVEYGSLFDQARIARTNYTQILDRLNQTKTTKNLEKIPLRTLDKATPPGAPFRPNLQRIIKTCTGVGLLVFFGIAIGLSFIDDRIKSAWDVEHFIGVNLLGIIPDLASMKDEDKYTLVLDNKQTPGVESFLSVYSSVKIHSKLDFPKSILITSTIPGEGKTLISCNLAGSFARHGKRTLLIDCDLRRPMLHRHFNQQNNGGLIPWFEAGALLDDDLMINPHLGIIKVGENLSLLCSGGRSRSPTELLESPLFGQLLEKLKRQFDLVVIDSPPLGAVTDSLLIAERTDEVIYVCRFNRAYRKHIRLYMKALRSGKNEMLGVVLNGLSPRRIEYYSNYRYYRSYKKYYGAQT